MNEQFDFIVVGAGSAGAVVAARLSEDPKVRVALIEAGGRPPPEELMPAACPALQVNPNTDWAYSADPGGAGRGLIGQRMMVPRGKMLGGSSGFSMGPDALRAPAGPLPADPAQDARLPPQLAGLKAEAVRRFEQWITTGESLVASSLYDAAAWYSTGLGNSHTHDAQIALFACGYNEDVWTRCLRVDIAQYFADPEQALAPDAESILILANPVQPHSEGEVTLKSADPTEHPEIRMNYFGDARDIRVMVHIMRRALELAANWPHPGQLGPLRVPPFLAEKHGHTPGAAPSDALLEDLARHYAFTVYHLTSTCRIGDVVDPELRVKGVQKLRVADASVMPNVISGNTNAPCIMIGEKAAEMIAKQHGVALAEFVGVG